MVFELGHIYVLRIDVGSRLSTDGRKDHDIEP